MRTILLSIERLGRIADCLIRITDVKGCQQFATARQQELNTELSAILRFIRMIEPTSHHRGFSRNCTYLAKKSNGGLRSWTLSAMNCHGQLVAEFGIGLARVFRYFREIPRSGVSRDEAVSDSSVVSVVREKSNESSSESGMCALYGSTVSTWRPQRSTSGLYHIRVVGKPFRSLGSETIVKLMTIIEYWIVSQ